jgi:hypothetical protein
MHGANRDICCKYFNLYRLAIYIYQYTIYIDQYTIYIDQYTIYIYQYTIYIYQYMHINCIKWQIIQNNKYNVCNFVQFTGTYNTKFIPLVYKAITGVKPKSNVYVPKTAVQRVPLFSSHSPSPRSIPRSNDRECSSSWSCFFSVLPQKCYDARLDVMQRWCWSVTSTGMLHRVDW